MRWQKRPSFKRHLVPLIGPLHPLFNFCHEFFGRFSLHSVIFIADFSNVSVCTTFRAAAYLQDRISTITDHAIARVALVCIPIFGFITSISVILPRYMRPDGTWQRLRRCPRATGGGLNTFPTPDRYTIPS